MAGARLITATEPAAWAAALAAAGSHDVYHLLEYHLVRCDLAPGQPALLAMQTEDGAAAVPLQLRPLADVPGLDDEPGTDAASAYGYPGALATVTGDQERFAVDFQAAFREELEGVGAATLFLRQHPLFDTDWLFEGIAEVVPLGRTVAIDLALDDDEARRQTRKSHRSELSKARRLGFTVREDPDLTDVATFRALYNETMDRAGAAPGFYFPHDYYRQLQERLGDGVVMFHADLDGVPASSAIVLVHGDIAHYHLGGTAAKWSRTGATRYLLEHVRQWAKARAMRWFHLGGGVGSQEDSLFLFKSGFSRTFFRYRVVRYVHNVDRYRRLNERHRRAAGPSDSDFFPAYRA